jgi:MFS family permease
MIPWLVVGVLRASPEATGMVQTAATLPGVLVLLVGGALADRSDARRVLTRLHLLAALPPLVLALCTATGHLSLAVVTTCAMASGVLNGLSYPARDSLLSLVGGGDVMRAVTGNTIAQFGSQGVGMLIAGAARWLGSAPVLLVQALLVRAGSLAARRLPSRGAPAPESPAPGAADVFAGLRFVLRSDLRAVLVLVCGIGLLFNGSYYVLMPLAVRDVYAGGVADVAAAHVQARSAARSAARARRHSPQRARPRSRSAPPGVCLVPRARACLRGLRRDHTRLGPRGPSS